MFIFHNRVKRTRNFNNSTSFQSEDKRNFAFCGIPFCGIKQHFRHATKGVATPHPSPTAPPSPKGKVSAAHAYVVFFAKPMKPSLLGKVARDSVTDEVFQNNLSGVIQKRFIALFSTLVG